MDEHLPKQNSADNNRGYVIGWGLAAVIFTVGFFWYVMTN